MWFLWEAGVRGSGGGIYKATTWLNNPAKVNRKVVESELWLPIVLVLENENNIWLNPGYNKSEAMEAGKPFSSSMLLSLCMNYNGDISKILTMHCE